MAKPKPTTDKDAEKPVKKDEKIVISASVKVTTKQYMKRSIYTPGYFLDGIAWLSHKDPKALKAFKAAIGQRM